MRRRNFRPRRRLSERMVKVEIDMYDDEIDNVPSRRSAMKVQDYASISKILEHTTFMAYKRKYERIEFRMGNIYLGSASKSNNWKFVKDRGFLQTTFNESIRRY